MHQIETGLYLSTHLPSPDTPKHLKNHNNIINPMDNHHNIYHHQLNPHPMNYNHHTSNINSNQHNQNKPNKQNKMLGSPPMMYGDLSLSPITPQTPKTPTIDPDSPANIKHIIKYSPSHAGIYTTNSPDTSMLVEISDAHFHHKSQRHPMHKMQHAMDNKHTNNQYGKNSIDSLTVTPSLSGRNPMIPPRIAISNDVSVADSISTMDTNITNHNNSQQHNQYMPFIPVIQDIGDQVLKEEIEGTSSHGDDPYNLYSSSKNSKSKSKSKSKPEKMSKPTKTGDNDKKSDKNKYKPPPRHRFNRFEDDYRTTNGPSSAPVSKQSSYDYNIYDKDSPTHNGSTQSEHEFPSHDNDDGIINNHNQTPPGIVAIVEDEENNTSMAEFKKLKRKHQKKNNNRDTLSNSHTLIARKLEKIKENKYSNNGYSTKTKRHKKHDRDKSSEHPSSDHEHSNSNKKSKKRKIKSAKHYDKDNNKGKEREKFKYKYDYSHSGKYEKRKSKSGKKKKVIHVHEHHHHHHHHHPLPAPTVPTSARSQQRGTSQTPTNEDITNKYKVMSHKRKKYNRHNHGHKHNAVSNGFFTEKYKHKYDQYLQQEQEAVATANTTPTTPNYRNNNFKVNKCRKTKKKRKQTPSPTLNPLRNRQHLHMNHLNMEGMNSNHHTKYISNHPQQPIAYQPRKSKTKSKKSKGHKHGHSHRHRHNKHNQHEMEDNIHMDHHYDHHHFAMDSGGRARTISPRLVSDSASYNNSPQTKYSHHGHSHNKINGMIYSDSLDDSELSINDPQNPFKKPELRSYSYSYHSYHSSSTKL